MKPIQITILLLALAAPLHAGTVTVTTNVDEDNGSLASTLGRGTSLREAVNYSSGGDTVVFDTSLSGRVIVIASGATQMEIDHDLTIDASALTLPVGVTASASRVFEIGADVEVTLQNLKIKGIVGSGESGGGIQCSGALELIDCRFDGNTADYSGGAVYVTEEGSLSASACIFTNNTADLVSGGALYCAGGAELQDCDFAGNRCYFYGGAAYVLDDCLVTGCEFVANEGLYGGALYLYSESETLVAEISGCAFDRNVAGSGGGAIRCDDGALQVTTTEFFQNTAESYGGAITAMDDLEVTESTFRRNTCNQVAGAIWSYNHDDDIDLLLTGSSFAYNSAGTDSGAVSCNGETTINDCEFFRNRVLIALGGSTQGGGAIDNSGTMIVSDTLFQENSVEDDGKGGAIRNEGDLLLQNSRLIGNAGYSGGAIFNSGPDSTLLEIYDSTLHGNTAELWGGAIYNADEVFLSGSTMSENTASTGGAIHNGGALTAVNSTLAKNEATSYGGAVYNQDSLTTLHVTISKNTGNCGGIYSVSGASLALDSTIVAANTTVATTLDANLVSSSTISGAYNFIGGSPRLAPLDNYGGATETMPPLTGSPVINGSVVTSDTPLTDQVGHDRPLGHAPEIGAVEFFLIPLFSGDDLLPAK